MKKLFQIISACMLTVLISNQAMAQTASWAMGDISKEIIETQIISTEQISKVKGSAKGRLLSSASIQISDEGNGVLGVYGDILCHANMKDIYMTIYLDVWDEKRGDWILLDTYNYEWHETNPEKDLSMVMVSFDVVGLARGHNYRLRSMNAARSYSNITEAMMPRTEGILLK